MNVRQRNLANDLVLPTILFAALGAMSWAVRGTRGFGGGAGCIFAGVLWGIAWWYCARQSSPPNERRYRSGWIVFAMVFGMAISGERGWMQWSHFFTGRLYTNFAEEQYVPISRGYGFLWLFIAGMPWAGISACFVAWCGALHETRLWHWVLRIACGLGAGAAFGFVAHNYPQYVLPVYSTIEDRYRDFDANPDLRRVVNDCTLALVQLGYYLGFVLFELLRRDWKNVVLILTVGIVNGAGWSALQNWKWAPELWTDIRFAWWRCWESSGGISIGIAFGLAYFLVNRRMSDKERSIIAARRAVAGPNFEWLLIFCMLASLLSVFVDELAGGRGSVGIGEFSVPLRVAAFLQQHFNAWGTIYFATAMLFAAAYYVTYRHSTADGAREERARMGLLSHMDWGAVCLVAAFIVPVLADLRLRQSIFSLLHLAVPDDTQEPEMSDGMIQFRILCVALATAAGIGWYLVRRTLFDQERSKNTPYDGDPNIERLGLFLGILASLALSFYNGLKGWFKIYRGVTQGEWLWHPLGPVYWLLLCALLAWILLRPLPRNYRGDLHPRAYGLVWLVLLVQNAIAQLVTGPLTEWREFSFNLYYLLLFIITALVIYHFERTRLLSEPTQAV